MLHQIGAWSLDAQYQGLRVFLIMTGYEGGVIRASEFRTYHTPLQKQVKRYFLILYHLILCSSLAKKMLPKVQNLLIS